MKRSLMTGCILVLISSLAACASVTTQEGDATKHSFLDGLLSVRVKNDGAGAGGLLSPVMHASAQLKNKLVFVTKAEEELAQRTLNNNGDPQWVEWQNEEIGRMRIRLSEVAVREPGREACRLYKIEYWDENDLGRNILNIGLVKWKRVGHAMGCRTADGSWRADRVSGD